MSDMFCAVCGNTKLVASTELQVGACIGCMSTFVGREKANLETIKVLRQEVERQRGKLVEFRALAESRMRLQKIKEDGIAAGEREIKLDENPYAVNSDEWIMWAGGWAEELLKASYAKQQLVMQNASQMLETVLELARGYEQYEIAEKLETVAGTIKKVLK